MNSAFTTSKPRTPWYKSRYFWLVFYTAIGLAILCGTMAAELDVTYFGLAGGFFGAFCSVGFGVICIQLHLCIYFALFLFKKNRV